MRFGAKRLGSSTPGVIAANDAAFADAKDWLYSKLIGAVVKPELQFSPSIYDYSAIPTFCKSRPRAIGLGEIRLRGDGQILIDGLE